TQAIEPALSNLQAITPQQHSALRWTRHSGWTFVIQDLVVPTVANEAGRAAMAMPLAFVPMPGGCGAHCRPDGGAGTGPGPELAGDPLHRGVACRQRSDPAVSNQGPNGSG